MTRRPAPRQSRTPSTFGLAVGAWTLFQVLGLGSAWAFPPYRSTDADTAERGTVELRLGALKLERRAGDEVYKSPLFRLNLGLTEQLELNSEGEYETGQGAVSDAAVGVKWRPRSRPFSVGIETLALLPLAPGQDGVGVESQILGTFRRGQALSHLISGGFHDPRPEDVENGWRASILGEVREGPYRVGAEVFSRQVRSEAVEVQAGLGVIIKLGRFDLRSGAHVGLTREAPDLTFSLWLSSVRQLW